MARHPACPARVFWLCNKVADGGEVVIQKQRFAIADRHAPESATTPSPFLRFDPHQYRNNIPREILPVGHHQGGYQLISPGLRRIESVSSCCRMLHNKKVEKTHDGFAWSVSCDDSTSLPKGINDPGRVKNDRGRCWSMVGRPDYGHAFKRA